MRTRGLHASKMALNMFWSALVPFFGGWLLLQLVRVHRGQCRGTVQQKVGTLNWTLCGSRTFRKAITAGRSLRGLCQQMKRFGCRCARGAFDCRLYEVEGPKTALSLEDGRCGHLRRRLSFRNAVRDVFLSMDRCGARFASRRYCRSEAGYPAGLSGC